MRRKEYFKHFASKRAFDIEGLGPKNIQLLLNKGLIQTPADLFDLKEGDLSPLERFAEKSAKNLISAIQAKRKISLSRFIIGLSILHVGEETAEDLAGRFSSIDKIKNASRAELEIISNIGQVVAESVYQWFHDPYNQKVLNQLLSRVKIEKPNAPVSKKLQGKNFVITGILESMIRDQAKSRIKEVSLPHTDYVLSCYYVIVPAEISANLARFDGVKYGLYKEGQNLFEDYLKTRGAGFGKEVRRRIILGTYVLSAGYYAAFYSRAQKVRVLIKEDFKKVFSQADILLTPVSPSPAFKIGEKTDDPVKMYLADIFTVSANLAGLPALSLPNGFVELKGTKLPSAIQLIAPWFEEEKLFYLGKQL